MVKSSKSKSPLVTALCSSTLFNVLIIKNMDLKRQMIGYTRMSPIKTASSKKPDPPFPLSALNRVIAKRKNGGKKQKAMSLLNFLMFIVRVDGKSG